MADRTPIEWTATRHADGTVTPGATWNIITGCTVISPGCTNCYAMRLAGTRMKFTPSRKGLTDDSKAGPVWNGQVRFNEEWLTQPLSWKKPKRIFVCAHGDLFHDEVPDEWIDRVFAVMALCPQHTFQVLTKRAKRMREYINQLDEFSLGETDEIRRARTRVANDDPPNKSAAYYAETALLEAALQSSSRDLNPGPGRGYLRNVWLGVSVEDQARADERIPELLATPAKVRFISAEPLLAPVDLKRWTAIDWQCSYCRQFFSGRHNEICPSCGKPGGWCGSHLFNGRHYPRGAVAPSQRGSGLDWVIAGGESGPGARPMHPDWARSLRDQCQAAGVAFFFKQWGEYQSVLDHDPQACGRQPDVIHVSGKQEFRPLEAMGLMATRAEGWAGMCRVGKKAAGHLLDGREWSEMPG